MEQARTTKFAVSLESARALQRLRAGDGASRGDAACRRSHEFWADRIGDGFAQASPDSSSKKHRSAHQGWTCDKPGYVETGRSPLDSRAAAAIAGSGSRMGGTAW